MQCEDGFHEEMSVVAKLTPLTFSDLLIIYSDAGYSLLNCVLYQSDISYKDLKTGCW